jgi:hypothetical protein
MQHFDIALLQKLGLYNMCGLCSVYVQPGGCRLSTFNQFKIQRQHQHTDSTPCSLASCTAAVVIVSSVTFEPVFSPFVPVRRLV